MSDSGPNTTRLLLAWPGSSGRRPTLTPTALEPTARSTSCSGLRGLCSRAPSRTTGLLSIPPIQLNGLLRVANAASGQETHASYGRSWGALADYAHRHCVSHYPAPLPTNRNRFEGLVPTVGVGRDPHADRSWRDREDLLRRRLCRG